MSTPFLVKSATPTPVPFSIPEFDTGLFFPRTRDGDAVAILTIDRHPPAGFQPVIGRVAGRSPALYQWSADGLFFTGNTCGRDLVLVPQQAPLAPFVPPPEGEEYHNPSVTSVEPDPGYFGAAEGWRPLLVSELDKTPPDAQFRSAARWQPSDEAKRGKICSSSRVLSYRTKQPFPVKTKSTPLPKFEELTVVRITYGEGVTESGVCLTGDRRIDARRWVRTRLVNAFGGCTQVRGDGAWKNPEGEEVCEPVVSFRAVIPTSVSASDAEKAAADIAGYIKRELEQECVLVEFSKVCAAFL